MMFGVNPQLSTMSNPKTSERHPTRPHRQPCWNKLFTPATIPLFRPAHHTPVGAIRPPSRTLSAAASGIGGGGGGSVPSFNAEPDSSHARLQSARASQMRSTDLLARLLEAADPVGLARQHLESLSEEFFMTASTYLTLARSEGNSDVAGRLEAAVGAAWSVKQASLRPELQLLNSLVRAETEASRRQLYQSGGSDLLSTLAMNDRWFAGCLARMTADVERQPPNPGKAALLSRLRAIKKETEALEKQAARQQQKISGQPSG